MFTKYKKQKQAEILEKYQGNFYAAIVKYQKRHIVAGGEENEIEFKFRLAKIEESKGKTLQIYKKVNDLAFEILDFAVAQMNRKAKFKKLEELLK